MKEKWLLEGEAGSVLVLSLVMMVLLTLLGIAATTTSSIEVQIAGNERFHKATFYAAEAGIEHLRADLTNLLPNFNQVGTGSPVSWTFALDGDAGANAARDTDGDGIGDFAGGVQWFVEEPFGDSYSYSVRIWNFDSTGDAGAPTIDTDGLIRVRSVATGPAGTISRIEAVFFGTGFGGVVSGYAAQEGAGSSKNYSSNDLNAIDFTTATRQL